MSHLNNSGTSASSHGFTSYPTDTVHSIHPKVIKIKKHPNNNITSHTNLPSENNNNSSSSSNIINQNNEYKNTNISLTDNSTAETNTLVECTFSSGPRFHGNNPNNKRSTC